MTKGEKLFLQCLNGNVHLMATGVLLPVHLSNLHLVKLLFIASGQRINTITGLDIAMIKCAYL